MEDLRHIDTSTLFAFCLGAAANLFLFCGWPRWQEGPWADCPNYAFSKEWFAVPPPSVTFIPYILSVAGIALVVCRFWLGRPSHSSGMLLVLALGFVLNILPIFAAAILPAISYLLNLTRPGC